MKTTTIALAAFLLLPLPGCVQVGPKDEPLHIILDVNIKVQVERDVEALWDKIEKKAVQGSESGSGS